MVPVGTVFRFKFTWKATYIMNRELSDERHRQYAWPSCFRSVAILDFRSGSSNCRAISSLCKIGKYVDLGL